MIVEIHVFLIQKCSCNIRLSIKNKKRSKKSELLNLSKSIFSNDTSLEISRKMHSIGRVGTPQNVSKFVIPLIADKSSWVTGSVINIDGGLSTTKIAS